MKRILSLSIALLLIASILFPVHSFALDDKELENAIKTSKSLLDIKDIYDNFNYSLSKQGSTTIYSLSWSDSKNKLGGVSAAINTLGRITSYYIYRPYDSSSSNSKLPKVSKSDALKAANEFIQKVNNPIWSKIEYKDDNMPLDVNDRNYHFYYSRVENGIPFPQNSVNISVDNQTGKVENFSCNWTDDLVFPPIDKAMAMDKAQQIYTDKLGLKLAYKINYGEENKGPYLVYTNVYSEQSIDAVTGEIVYGSIYHYSENAKMTAGKGEQSTMDSQQNVVLTPEEKKAVENAANFIDQKKAESIARSVLKLDSGFILESINMYSNGRNKGEYIWNMNFNKQEKKDDKSYSYNASVSVDASSGDVLNFYRYSPSDKETAPTYSKDKALIIAQDFIKSMQPAKSGEVEYTNWQESAYREKYDTEVPRQIYFTFTRKSNNAYFIDNGFNVTVDTSTGMITNYGFNWYKGPLPSAANAMNSSAAHKLLYDKIGLRLQYMTDYSKKIDTRKIMPPQENQVKPDIRLVYSVKPGKPVNIDAVSGNLVDYYGKPYEDKIVNEYTDIAGNYAENQIKILSQYGISLPGNQFKPNQTISQREFLYLAAKSLNSYMDIKLSDDEKNNDSLYNYFVSLGLIKESERSTYSVVSKQEAVKYLIRALKYDKIADIKGIYKLPLKDSDSINADFYGYTAIAYGLNIIKDEDGYFKPNAYITRADAAAMIYNFLNIN